MATAFSSPSTWFRFSLPEPQALLRGMAHVTTNHGLAVCMQTAAVLLVCGLQEPPLVGLQFAAAAAEVHCRHC